MMNERQHTGDQIAEARRHGKRLDFNGVLWLVHELPALPLDRRSTCSLVLESEPAVRRVRIFPPEWRELSDEELFALSWSS